MSEYDLSFYQKEVSSLALEIERKLLVLNVDWNDSGAMHELAREVLQPGTVHAPSEDHSNRVKAARVELFGLVALMNKVMAEAAERGVEVHGNDAWKALAKALWAEKASS